jgi:rfaE bifunctional protein kinase chain/domain
VIIIKQKKFTQKLSEVQENLSINRAKKEFQSSELTMELAERILREIKNLRVGIIGDVCLDVYWHADMTLSKLSRETPHFPLPIVDEKMSLGGAGNVAANVCDLGAGNIFVLTVIGRDWRGDWINRLFLEKGINTENVITSDKYITPAYCKPIRKGLSEIQYEDPRIDFENRKSIDRGIESEIIEKLNLLYGQIDILLVVDQLENGIVNQVIRDSLSNISNENTPIVVDSRDRIHLYSNVIVKPNHIEAVTATHTNINIDGIDHNTVLNAAKELSKKTDRPVIVTMGPEGSTWFERKTGKAHRIPAYPVQPPIDIVGAGDTFLAAFGCAYGTGNISGPVSVAFGNLASSIILKKIGTTGTASSLEILEKLR